MTDPTPQTPPSQSNQKRSRLFGAHISVAGGAHLAFGRAQELGCGTMQIFVKNANRWQQRPLTEAEIALFRQASRDSRLSQQPIEPVLAHASYLINLATDDVDLHRRSTAALIDEVERCEQLGVSGLVLHPGSHLGRGVEQGSAAVARGLDQVLAKVARGSCRIVLENTAGQGNTLGRDLEELAAIRLAVEQPDRVGICIDTCHAFAAGHALHIVDESLLEEEPDAGYEPFWRRVLELFPPPILACLHLNDSKGDCGSRLDRHENLGVGKMGAPFFERLAQDPRFLDIPMVLETPKGANDMEGYRRDLELLHRWSLINAGQG